MEERKERSVWKSESGRKRKKGMGKSGGGLSGNGMPSESILSFHAAFKSIRLGLPFFVLFHKSLSWKKISRNPEFPDLQFWQVVLLLLLERKCLRKEQLMKNFYQHFSLCNQPRKQRTGTGAASWRSVLLSRRERTRDECNGESCVISGGGLW